MTKISSEKIANSRVASDTAEKLNVTVDEVLKIAFKFGEFTKSIITGNSETSPDVTLPYLGRLKNKKRLVNNSEEKEQEDDREQ